MSQGGSIHHGCTTCASRDSIPAHLPTLWNCLAGNDAGGCLPTLLHVLVVQVDVEAQERRLLRFLLLRFCPLPTGSVPGAGRVALALPVPGARRIRSVMVDTCP